MRNDLTRKSRDGGAKIAARPSVYGTGFIALDVVRNYSGSQAAHAYAGGTCGNVLAALAYLGWNSYPIARLNGDVASERVKDDFRKVGVTLELAACTPTTNTPIVIQVIRQSAKGTARHHFEWACPLCGNALPRFRPVPARAVREIATKMTNPSVFFMDRVSRSSLQLAKIAADRGALVYFEPSDIANARLFREALGLAHIVKYSNDRLRSLGAGGKQAAVLLEIKTLGTRGLAYRSRMIGSHTWFHLRAISASILKDTCGAGDWCSAGVIASLGSTGLPGLINAHQEEIVEALCYGQALAAWNCGFEGARGGMYSVERTSFSRQIKRILGKAASSEIDVNHLRSLRSKSIPNIVCPACPTPRVVRTRSRLTTASSPVQER